MKTLLATIAIVAPALSSANAVDPAPKPSVEPPPKRLVVYQVPKATIHYCTDYQEAERRWKTTKEMTTADVFSLSGESAIKALTPITRVSPIREFGGGTDAEPSKFGIDVTDKEDKSIRDALAKGELFIIYYHYGW